VAELADVKFAEISSSIDIFNNKKTCGFNDWRLPTKQELLTLKPIHSDAYFHIGTLKEVRNFNTYYHDYVWTQPKEGDDDEAVHLRMQSDYDLPHTSMNDNNVKLILVRDDILAATNFDVNIEKYIEKVNAIDDLKTDFDNIDVDTSATAEEDIKTAFRALSTLPSLLEDRQEKIAAAKTVLTTAEAQHISLYIDMKTVERTNNLSTEQAAQTRIQNELVVDTHNLKNKLNELFAQYDTVSFSSDNAKAEVLSAGISSANAILALLTDLGDKLGDDATADKAAIQSLVAARITESETLPIVSINGFFKIAKNGNTAKTSTAYGDAWRCVQKTDIIGGFTTKINWTILDNLDLKNNHSTATQRLIDINTENLCGINTWQLPSKDALKTLKTIDITTSSGTQTKTIDDAIFIHHQDAIKTAPYYWTNDSGLNPNIVRYAQADIEESSSSTRKSNDDTVSDVNSRFFYEVTTYTPGDTSCGENGVRFGSNCYQVHTDKLSWEDARQNCIDSGQHLIANSALTKKDYSRLQLGLNLVSGETYWLTKETTFSSYAHYLKEETTNIWEENTFEHKSNPKAYICTGPAIALSKPTAPTSPTHDDDANTFGWTNATGFDDATDYQYSLDNGISWKDVVSNPINPSNLDIAAGHVQVRVKAAEDTNPTGDTLKSLHAFTKQAGPCAGGDAAGEIDGNCYTRHDSEKNWTEARDFCIADSASLVTQATAISIASNLATELSLATSSTYYWLLDNELNYNRAQALTYYGSWSTYNKDLGHQQPFICVK
jgi:hypothetical protein